MKADRVLVLISALFLVLAGPGVGRGEVLTVNPSRAAILPVDESGQTKIALFFDISGLKEGLGRRIEGASVDWRISGTSSELRVSLEAYPITSSWVEGAASAVTTTEEAVVFWDIEPIDNERNGNGLVRLDLQDLVASWAMGTAVNHGILITTPDLTRSLLADQLRSARLTVRYGFVR